MMREGLGEEWASAKFASIAMRLRRSASAMGALLLTTLLAAPSVWFLLPSYYCHLGENYQPMKALRFFSSLGADFHKYGPLDNFLLAPGYGISLFYWWAEGSFSSPSGDFPYGFAKPLEQISFLILQGRVVVLALFLASGWYLMRALGRSIASLGSAALAFVLCVGTNPSAIGHAAQTRPDGPMLAFLFLSLSVYVDTLVNGLSARRGVWLSLLAVGSISAKEIAGPVFVLPYLYFAWCERQRCGGVPACLARLRRNLAIAGATGVGSYLLINVVYAPQTWWLRMQHWLSGSGADSSVWANAGSTPLSQTAAIAASFLDTLGPGGCVVVPVSVGIALSGQPRIAMGLLVPFASFVLLGMVPLGYSADYFTTVATTALVPVVALGVCTALKSASPWIRHSTGIALVAAVSANALFATFAWHRLTGVFPVVVERDLAQHPLGDALVATPDVHPHVPGKSRLEWLGFHFDTRSLAELLMAPPRSLPDRIYVSAGFLGFLAEGRLLPARANMLRDEGLDLSEWKGFEALGYVQTRAVQPTTPAWYPFASFPVVRAWNGESAVLVFERHRDLTGEGK